MVQVRKLRTASLIAGLLSIGSVGQAANFTAPAPVIPVAPASVTAGATTYKDWRVEERASAESAAGVCVAATTALLGGVKQDLEVLIDRSGARPVEMRIRPDADLPTTVALKTTVDKKVYNFAKVASVDAARDVFWNIPRGTEELVAILKRDLKLEAVTVDGTATPQKVTFSLSGSSAALTDLAKRCNAGKTLGSDGFERAFLPTIVATVDASKLTPSMTDLLRSTVSQANVAWKTSNLTQSKIEALTTKYLAQINELTKLKTNLDRLQNQEVINLQKRRAAAEGLITTSQQQIDGLRPQIAVNEAKLAQANADYEAAYRILEPHIARHDQLVDIVVDALSDESAASKRLDEIDRGTSSWSSEVNRLNNELNSVRSQLGGARSDAAQLDQVAQSAHRDMNSFDEQNEIRRRKSQNSEIDNLERRLRDLDQIERDARNRLDQAETRLRQAESRHSQISQQMQQAERTLDRATTNREHALQALRRCQDTAGADCSNEQAKLEFAKNEVDSARSGVDALKGDYQRAQSELSQIRSHVNDAERDMRSAQQDKQNVHSRLASRIDEIERVVHEHKNQLVSRYREAQARADQADQRVNALEAEARDIAQVELPHAQSELNRWSAARPGAVSDLRRAQQDVANARAARDSFKQSVGWDQKEAAVSAAQGKVSSIKGTLAQIDADIKKREKQIRESQAELVDVQKKMEVALEAIRVKQARSAEVQKALEPYDQERAVLDQTKATSDRQFADARTAFAANLPQ
ncbi:MAG: hypothetical protein AAB250_18945 [Bdellovibrionota bacterium]